MIIAEKVILFICILLFVYMIYQHAYTAGFVDGIDRSREILDTILNSVEGDDGKEEET